MIDISEPETISKIACYLLHAQHFKWQSSVFIKVLCSNIPLHAVHSQSGNALVSINEVNLR